MKEFESIPQEKFLEGTEIQANQEKKKEFKLIASQRKISGLTLFEYNLETCVLQPAEFKKQDVSILSLSRKESNLKINHRVEIKSDCYYFQRLNRKSAIDHLMKKGRRVK